MTQQGGETRNAIAAANRIFMSAFARGDAAGLAALYTATAQLLPTHSEPVTGTQAIRTFWQTVIDMGIKEGTLETLELEDHGDTAHEVGRYTLRGEAGQVLDRGKYVVIWKREGGQWKLHRDIWNSSLPASPP
jgi:ketosteroid isomerase-like protein